MKPRISVIAMLALVIGACGDKADEPAAEDAAAETAAEEAAPALPRTASVPGAGVFFIIPADGDVVSSPVTVEFGIAGMAVAPAGDNTEHTGHHHLIVDAELPDFGRPIPASENYIHFGDGSTFTTIELEPGTHTLQLLLGDHLHIPHDPPVKSAVITIEVE